MLKKAASIMIKKKPSAIYIFQTPSSEETSPESEQLLEGVSGANTHTESVAGQTGS